MLLTLHASSLRHMLKPKRSGRRDLELTDLPNYAHETLGLNGLNLPTDLLAGAGRSTLETIRDRGDKAGCACLLLVEVDDQPITTKPEESIDRMGRIIEAGTLLGCSAVAIPIKSRVGEENFEKAVEALKRVMLRADKRDINVLIAPRSGLTADPDTMTELIKRVGGFRIGVYPDFQTAAKFPDPEAYLKRITPYATAVAASLFDFKVNTIEPPKPEKLADEGDQPQDDPTDPLSRLEQDIEDLLGPDEDEGPIEEVIHSTYDILPMVRAITAVGFDGNLAIECRGKGDGTLNVLHARTALEQALQQVALEG